MNPFNLIHQFLWVLAPTRHGMAWPMSLQFSVRPLPTSTVAKSAVVSSTNYWLTSFLKKNSCILVTLWFAGSMLCYPYWNWLTSRDLHFWQNITNSIRWIFDLWSMFTRSSALSPSSPYSNQEFISPFHKLCDSLRKGAQGIAKRISFRNGTLSRWMMGIQSSGPPLHECNRILRVHRLAMLWQLNDLDGWMFNTFQLNGLWLFWNGCIPYYSFILQYQ